MKTFKPFSLIQRYDNPHDAAMRLTGSILVYNEELVVYVEGVEYVERAVCLDCLSGSLYEINANDEALDVNQAPLGFMNMGHKIVYLAYPPHRSQKSGVTLNTLHQYGPSKVDINKSILSSLAKTMLGQYPTLAEVLKTSTGGAVSRNYALVPGKNSSVFSVFFKNSPVGVFLKDQKKFLFPDSRLDKSREFELNYLIDQQGDSHDYQVQRLLG